MLVICRQRMNIDLVCYTMMKIMVVCPLLMTICQRMTLLSFEKALHCFRRVQMTILMQQCKHLSELPATMLKHAMEASEWGN